MIALLPPGATIGILGGGQLGRMTALTAARLGYRCHIYAPEAESPAAEVASAWTRAAYTDRAALERFAQAVDVVTLEFENVAVEALELLASHVPVRPGAEVLRVTQDRLAEKDALTRLGAAVTSYWAVGDAAALRAALELSGGQAVLKTRRMGYDGKGQQALRAGDDLEAAIATFPGADLILERWVDFSMEISVVTARGPDGDQRSYVPVHNHHENHILKTSTAPAPIAAPMAQEAVALAERVARGLGVVGLLGVEMFVGRDGRLLVNELAPRPHNSGHWTMDACAVSQFEQLVRAVCGLPLGDTTRHADAVMTNLLGDEAADFAAILAEPGARLHLYGKREARPGRKMGHVNRLQLPGTGPAIRR